MGAVYFLVGALLWGYGLAFLAALCLALIFGKNWKWKIGGAIVVIMVFIGPIWKSNWTEAQEHKRYKIKYDRVKALFDERCKTAGVKIYETADDVDGVLLRDVPPKVIGPELKDPNWKYAALPELIDDDPKSYIYSYVHQKRAYGYADVEYSDGDIKRYTIIFPDPEWPDSPYGQKSVEENIKNPARYAISLASVPDGAGRAHGIAGLTATITDTKTNTVMATSTWYSFNTSFETPVDLPYYSEGWRYVRQTCPELRARFYNVPLFVAEVLKPRKESQNNQ